jgi:hypothetical protein
MLVPGGLASRSGGPRIPRGEGHYEAAWHVQGDPDEGFGLCDSDSDYMQNLVASMPRRLAEVIEKDG